MSLIFASGMPVRISLSTSSVVYDVPNTRCGPTTWLKRVALGSEAGEVTSGFFRSAASIGSCGTTRAERAHQAERPRDAVDGGAAQQVGVARHRVGLPRPSLRRWRRLAVGLVGVDRGEDLGARHRIDGGVVDAQEDRDRVLRDVVDVVEPVDEVQLPRRPAEVERAGVDAGDLGAELPPGAGPGQRDVAHVVLEVEAAVPDRPRPVEAEGHVDHPLAEALGHVEAGLDVLQHLVLGRRTAVPRGRVVDPDHADGVVGTWQVQRDHRPVGSGQLSHAVLPRLCPFRIVRRPLQRRAWSPLAPRTAIRWSSYSGGRAVVTCPAGATGSTVPPSAATARRHRRERRPGRPGRR